MFEKVKINVFYVSILICPLRRFVASDWVLYFLQLNKDNYGIVITSTITVCSRLSAEFVLDESIAQFMRDNISKLIECLETDNGLADCLFSKGVLSSEQYEELTNKFCWKSFQEQNRELLKNMLLPKLESRDIQRMLMSALVETDQRHIFNFITNSKGLFITHIFVPIQNSASNAFISQADTQVGKIVERVCSRTVFISFKKEKNTIPSTFKKISDSNLPKFYKIGGHSRQLDM